MLCRNKKCNKGNFGKRAKFEQKSPSHFYCSQECLFEDMHTEAYKKKVAAEIKKSETQKKKEFRTSEKISKRVNPLQTGINKLSKMIDDYFEVTTCMDCNQPFQGQKDASHVIDVGGNTSTRYHLENIWTCRAYCNQYKNSHKADLKQNITKVFGADYLEYLESLPLQYPLIKLSTTEFNEKVSIVNDIIRNFNTHKLEDRVQARKYFNQIIGIYLK